MISIILPIYNSKETLSLLIQKLFEILWQEKLSWEIICINDASTDNSEQLLLYLQSIYPQLTFYSHNQKIGYYLSAIEGISKAEGNILGFLDYPPDINLLENIPRFIQPIISGKAEIVVGKYPFPNFTKSILNKIVQTFIPLTDPLSSFFFAQKEVFHDIKYSTNGISIGLEIYVKGTYKTIKELNLNNSIGSGNIQILALLKQIRLLKKYLKSI